MIDMIFAILRKESGKMKSDCGDGRILILGIMLCFNFQDSIFQAERERDMTPEELAIHKENTLKERIPPLGISSNTSMERLKELALNLQVKFCSDPFSLNFTVDIDPW